MKSVVCDQMIEHVINCPYCYQYFSKESTSKAGSTKSDKKSDAARLNGLKGGRPRKEK